jgi:hypothetical protein
MTRRSGYALATVVLRNGSEQRSARSQHGAGAPLAADGGQESGPTSGWWGDRGSGPTGMHIGCIRDRRLAVLIAVRNRTSDTITLLGGGGPQPFRTVIERLAMQVRLAPVPPDNRIPVMGTSLVERQG